MVALFTPVCAQEWPQFIEKLSIEDGLSGNEITDLATDEDGFLWIATTNGLNRFDGTEVTRYFTHSVPLKLPGNTVNCILALRGSWMAIGTETGLCFYNYHTGKLIPFYYTVPNDPFELQNNAMVQMETDGMGNLWVASRNCIFIFDKNFRLLKKIFSGRKAVQPSISRIRFIVKLYPVGNNGMILLTENGKLFCENAMSKPLLLKESDLQSSWYQSAIGESRTSKIYRKFFIHISRDADSLEVYNEQGKKLTSSWFPFTQYPSLGWSSKFSVVDSGNIVFSMHNYGICIIKVNWQEGIPTLRVNAESVLNDFEFGKVTGDFQGNWWLATTNDGLLKITPARQSFKEIVLADSPKNTSGKWDVSEVSRYKNTLWAATYGGGFFELDLSTGKSRQRKIKNPADSLGANLVWNVRQINKDSLWVGTQAGLFWYSLHSGKNGRLPAYPGKPAVLDSFSITTQFRDTKGRIWMGIGGGRGLCYFNPSNNSFSYFNPFKPNGYPFRYPLQIIETQKGELYMVSDSETSLLKWDDVNKLFNIIALPASLKGKLRSSQRILDSKKGYFWIGTMTGGLVKFNPSTNETVVYGMANGLNNSNVNDMFCDRSGKIWLSTHGGISFFDPKTERFTNFTYQDGLSRGYVGRLWYDSVSGQLFTCGKGKIIRFDPNSFQAFPPPEKTLITAVFVNGKPIGLTADKPIRLPIRRHDLIVRYTTVDLTDGPELQYAYRFIQGDSSAWMPVGKQRQLNFSNLAAGNYLLQLRSSNRDGNWNTHIAELAFFVPKPFTQTIWFFLLLLLGVAAISYFIYRNRIAAMLRTEKMRNDISGNLHDEIGAQLTDISLSSMLALKDKNKAENLLQKIYENSQHISESLREIVWSINPQIDTLKMAFPKMLRYAADMLEAKDIELHINMSEKADNIKLAMQQRHDLYLIFKEAVNNLVRHSAATAATIEIKSSGQKLTLTIKDNGKGFITTNESVNNGLRNMHHRAEKHHWDFKVHSVPGEGTTVQLVIDIA